MRQIKYILIDDSGRKNREHHYSISSKGCVTESTDIRKAVKVIDRQVDPDGYNANSVVVRLVSGFKVQGSKFKVQSSKFKVQGSKFGLPFTVQFLPLFWKELGRNLEEG